MKNVQFQPSNPPPKKLPHPRKPPPVPNIKANPIAQYVSIPIQKSIVFFIIIFPEFFALVKPVSTMAKPACIKNTSIPPINVHVQFRFVCTKSAVLEKDKNDTRINIKKTIFFILITPFCIIYIHKVNNEK